MGIRILIVVEWTVKKFLVSYYFASKAAIFVPAGSSFLCFFTE